MRRPAARSVLACACTVAFGIGAVSADAANAPVAIGDYEGAPVVETGGSYQIATFSVTKESGKRTIVASAEYDGIYYPDVGECDNLALPLTADIVPISTTGRFRIKDKATVGDIEVTVSWKGHWTKAKRVAGTITIKSGDGCTSTEDWTGRRSA